MLRNDLPLQIVVLTGLSGDPEAPLPRPRDRRLVTLTRQSLPIALKAQRARLKLRAPGVEGAWAVTFSELADFSETRIAQQIAAAGASEEVARSVGASVGHDPAFCALCAAWYGLDFLLRVANGRADVVVRCWDITKRDLFRDLQRATEFDQSVFFKRIYEEGIGMFGAGAVSLILADYSLSLRPEDIELAEKVSQVAGSAYAAVLFGAAPQYCGVEGWEVLHPNFDAAWFNESTATAKLRSFRSSYDSPYTFALTAGFRAGGEAGDPPAGVWLNPVYLAAAAAIENFRDDTFEPGEWGLPKTLIDFEFCFGEGLKHSLAEIGVNVLGADVAPDGMRAISAPGAGPAKRLAQLLIECRLAQRSQMFRRERGTGSGLDEVLEDAREWLESVPEARDAGQYKVESRGQSLLLQTPGDGKQPRYFSLTPPKDGPQELRNKLLVRVLVLADFHCGIAREEKPRRFTGRRGVEIEPYQFDEVLDGYSAHSKVKLTAPSVFSEGFPVEIDFELRHLDDFAPEGSLRQIDTCRQLLDERRRLVDLGALADAKKGRWAVLEEAAQRPGGLRGLACRLEAWTSGRRESGMTPYSMESLAEELGEWIGGLPEPAELEQQMALLGTYQRWADEQDFERREPEALCATLAEIDRLISTQARPVFQDPVFLQIERTWRSLKMLVDAIGEGTSVRTLEMDWYARSLQPTAKEWVLHRRLMATLEDVSKPGFAETALVTLAVVDYHFDSERPGLRSLRHIVERVQSSMLFAICAITPRSAGGAQGDLERADPMVRRLVTGKGGDRLILVTGTTMLRPGYSGEGEHAVKFCFTRGCDPLPPLYATSIYRAAAQLAMVGLEMSRSLNAEERCIAVRNYLRIAGMDCRPLGRAMVVWQRESE